MILAALLPATYTARSLLLVGDAPGPGMAVQTMLPEVPGLRMISADATADSLRTILSRNGPPRVVVVGLEASTAAEAATQLASALGGYAAAADDAQHRVAQTAADIAAADQSLDGLRQQAGVADWDEATREASRRVALLARQHDEAEQQASAAGAGSRAALKLLAGQPGNVLEFREAAAAPANDPARALLVGLLVEREHLLAQYAPDYPGIREINEKIGKVRASMAEDAKMPRVTVREARNPAVDRLSGQANAAIVTASEANARLTVIQQQLEGARAQATLLSSSQPRVQALQRLRTALEQADRQQRAALGALPPLVALGAPVIEAIDHTAEYLAGLAGLLIGLASAVAAAFVPRLAVYQRRPAMPSLSRRPMQMAPPQPLVLGSGGTLPLATPRLIRAPVQGASAP